MGFHAYKQFLLAEACNKRGVLVPVLQKFSSAIVTMNACRGSQRCADFSRGACNEIALVLQVFLEAAVS